MRAIRSLFTAAAAVTAVGCLAATANASPASTIAELGQ